MRLRLDKQCNVNIVVMLGLLSRLDGPPQGGQGQNGQYVYWICMAYPSEAIVREHGVKVKANCTPVCRNANS